MAKRRMKIKTSKNRSYFKAKSKSRKTGSSSANEMGLIVGGAVYGVGRSYAEQLIAPLTNNLGMLGDYADEAVLGVTGYFMSKGKIPLINKVPYSKEIGKAMLVIESARVGSALGSQLIGKPQPTSTAYIYK